MYLNRLNLSGSVPELASTTDDKTIVSVRPNASASEADIILRFIDLEFQILWQETKSTYAPQSTKVVDDLIWFNSGNEFEVMDTKGTIVRHLRPQLMPDEWISNYLVYGEFVLACTVERYARSIEEKTPRILCLSQTGETKWSTELPIILPDALRHKGRVGKWRPDYNEAIIVSKDRILVTYLDESSGIGTSYCVSTFNGELLWHTKPMPTGSRVALQNGNFLIGSQGYGAFDTWHYNRKGEAEQHWKTHGYIIISENGEFRIIEMENVLPSRMHVGILRPDGSVERGAYLDSYYTSYPVIDSNDNIWFWRNGKVYRVDADLRIHPIIEIPVAYNSPSWSSRMLLQANKLIFATSGLGNSDLWILDIGSASIAGSYWCCGLGNLGANPVIS